MPKSTPAELRDLREEVFSRDRYRCVWPGCSTSEWDQRFFGVNPTAENLARPLQLAHLVHRGMGGSKYANRPDNCVTLCRLHHDIFDGRDGSSNTKRELAVMLKAQIS